MTAADRTVVLNVLSATSALRDMATLLPYDPVEAVANLRMLADRVEAMAVEQEGSPTRAEVADRDRSRVDVEPIVLLYAFRYALGRMTYAVGDVADVLIEHREAIRSDWRVQIVRDIRDAVDGQRAGMACDVERWLRVAERFEAMECSHQWVSMRNRVIESGERCVECGAVRAEPVVAPTREELLGDG